MQDRPSGLTVHDEGDVGEGSGSALAWSETQQVSPVDEAEWTRLMQARRDRWGARVTDGALTAGQRRYAARRHASIGRTRAAVVAACATKGAVVECHCKRGVRWYTCRKHAVCGRCRGQRAKRLGARIRFGLEGRERELPPARGAARAKPVMLTITVRHSGDVGRDRAALAAGWRAFYRAYHRRWGAFPYVGTWEVTAGRDGLGHPHAHVIVLWPFRDWSEIAAMWRAACPESSHINLRAASSLRGAARYIAKYVAKGVEADEFTPVLRARVLAGTYGTRWVFSSRKFWEPFVPLCKCCGQATVRVGRLPESWRSGAHYPWRYPEPDWEPGRGAQTAFEEISKAFECSRTCGS